MSQREARRPSCTVTGLSGPRDAGTRAREQGKWLLVQTETTDMSTAALDLPPLVCLPRTFLLILASRLGQRERRAQLRYQRT